MEEVLSVMIRTQSSSIRSIATNVLYNCVQNLPFSEALLEKVLLKLMNNLEFPEREGKAASASVLTRLIKTLPLELLEPKIQVMTLTLVTRAVNETHLPLKLQFLESIEEIFSRVLKSSKLAGLQSTLLEFCLQFLKDEEAGTKRAGILLLQSWVKAGLKLSILKKQIEIVFNSIEEIVQKIEIFYSKLEEDKELRAILDETNWKDLAFNEGEQEHLLDIKSTKLLTYDCVGLLLELFSKFEQEQDEEEQIQICRTLASLKGHPDEDIQMILLSTFSGWYSGENSASIASRFPKQTLMLVFSTLKSKACSKDWFIKKVSPINAYLFGELSKKVPSLKISYFKAINKILIRKMKYFQKNVLIFQKALSVYLNIFEKLCDEVSHEELTELLSCLIRLQENGNAQTEKEVMLSLEQVKFIFNQDFRSFGGNI